MSELSIYHSVEVDLSTFVSDSIYWL